MIQEKVKNGRTKALIEYVWLVSTHIYVCLYNFLLTNIFIEQWKKIKE